MEGNDSQSVPRVPPSDPPAEARSDAAEPDGTPRDEELDAASEPGAPRSASTGEAGGHDEDDERQMRQPDNQAPGAAAPAADETAPTTPAAPADENGERSRPATDGPPSPAPAGTSGAPKPPSNGSPAGPPGASTPSVGAEAWTGPGPDAPRPGPDSPSDGGPGRGTLPETERKSEAAGPAGDETQTVGPASPAASGDDLAVTTELPQVDVPDTETSVTPPPPAPPSSPPPASTAPPAPPSGPPPPPRPTYPVFQVPTTKADAPTEVSSAPPKDEEATRPAARWGGEPAARRGGAYADATPTYADPAPTEVSSPAVTSTRADEQAPAERPRHLRAPARASRHDAPPDDDARRRRLMMLATLVPTVLLLVVLVGWAVDSAALSGQVVRNVEVAGQPVGGMGEASVPDVVAEVAADVASREVVIEVRPQTQGWTSTGGAGAQAEPQTYTTNAEALGLTLDQRATVEAALDVGRDDPIFIRPFKWVASFFTTREVPLQYSVSRSQMAGALQMLQGNQRTQPTEPKIELREEGFVPVEGHPGTGLNPEEISDELLAAIEESPGQGRITIQAQPTDIEPYFSMADVEELANRANDMTADGLTLKAADHTVEVPAEQLRQWITPTETEEGGERRLDLAFNTQAAQDAIPGMFTDLSAEPVNARVELQNGQPAVVPGQNGVHCCGEQAGARVWEALQGGQAEVELETEVAEPEHTTEEVQGWGINEPIGGARAHRNDQDIAGPAPGFTTYYDPGQPRVTNIHRIAELTNGAVIAPGETFSLNDHVGERTAAKGFVPAGAIRDGQHVEEIGGGVSQFFTTLFNAAYFAGVDIEEYQAHSENFPRYPNGREATGGFPRPNLVLHNNTPHGILIATSYTDTSVTVTFWSTPYATAEQTGLTSSNHGQCVDWTSTRTRTYPDGTTERDSFTARYRPGEGINCEGQQITPPPTGG